MSLQQILIPSITKAIHELFDTAIDKIEFQATRKDFEGDITMVIFPLLKIIKDTRGGAEQSGAKQDGNKLVFTIAADRFLRNMVRAIVGTMINIGTGKISLADFEKILDSKDRSQAGFSVPAQGLYLTKIEYEYLK